MYIKPKLTPKPQPNPVIKTAETLTNQFLSEFTDETNSRINNLIQRNTNLGGDPRGYTYQGIDYSGGWASVDYIPPIDPSLEKAAEALYLRAGRLQGMRIKLQQALVSILGRCQNLDTQVIRDALPDDLIERTFLAPYHRSRPMGFLLKVNPMLAAPYRTVDEALLFLTRYRLLD